MVKNPVLVKKKGYFHNLETWGLTSQ